jgi:DDE_Tnp_1-associated
MDDLAELFEDLEDPRTGNAKRHALHEMVLIALCAVLSGGETCADMALFGRLKQDFLKVSGAGARHSEPRYVQPAISAARSGGLPQPGSSPSCSASRRLAKGWWRSMAASSLRD